MDIEDARKLKVGDRVAYPADRGDPGGIGEVTHVGTKEGVVSDSKLYVWVNVKGVHHESVWPSNRLSIVSRAPRNKP